MYLTDHMMMNITSKFLVRICSVFKLELLVFLFLLISYDGDGQTIIYSENFNSETDTYPLHSPSTGSSSWSATYISGSTGISTDSRWAIFQPAGTSSKLLEMYVGGTDKVYLLTKACNTVAFDNNVVDATCFSSLTLSYDWAAGGESGNTDDYLIPVYSTNNGVTWNNLGPTQHHNSASYPALQSVTNLDISALNGLTFKIGFRWVNDAATGTNNGPLVDNIVIRGVIPPCTFTPPNGVASINYTTGCQGITVDLSSDIVLPVNPCTSVPTYQWQSSPDGSSSWVNLAGQTNPSAAVDVANTTKYYRLASTCSGLGGSTSYSNVVSFTAVACTDYLLNAATNGTTINTCMAMFYDNGGNAGNYANSQTRTVTFCSDNGEHVMVDFMMFETENNGLFVVNQVIIDVLSVFDGPTTASPQMFSLSGGSLATEGVAPLLISSGTCLTFRFVANGSNVDLGWKAMVSCTDQQNNIASNYCATAPFICNLNGYQGSTTNFYIPESVGGQIGSAPSSFPGTLDNNSFIKFVPTSTSVSFDLEVSNCSGGITSTSGFYEAIQFAVYAQGSGGNCDLGAWVSDYDDVWDGIVPGNYTKTLSGLTIGATYYIVFDGLWGTVCDYKINVLSGITLPVINVDEATICLGDDITLTASGGTSYLWSNGDTSPSIVVSAADTYEVTVLSGNPLCPDNTLLNSIIAVDNCALPVTLSSLNAHCVSKDEQVLSWITESENNSDYFNVERSDDGQNWSVVGQVSAAGWSSSSLSYNFTDNHRSTNVFYYRLVQIDLNGDSEVFGPISIICSSNLSQFHVYPNPSENELVIVLNQEITNDQTKILFLDLNGKEVKQINPSKLSSQIIKVDLSDIESGFYFVQLHGAEELETSIKLIKL
jgi:hypothetical protein